MTKIYYNNTDIFSGLAPTPLVELSEEPVYYGNLWTINETITLNGQITGQCETFEQIIGKQNTLISRLGPQFKALSIVDLSGSPQDIYNWPICKIKNIDFAQSRYSQLLDFSISFECYDSGKFSGYYGVLDPINELSFNEENNGIVTIKHNCSARGINTNNVGTGALLNAKNYVSTISGWSSISGFVPAFVEAHAGATPILVTLNESLDRFNNTYSIEETWSYDPSVTSLGILRYETSLTSGVEDGTTEVNIRGLLQGGLNSSISSLRSRLSSINFFDIASGSLVDFSSDVLNVTELTSEITEDPLTNTIEFSKSYDNNSEPNPYFINSITITINKNGKSTASIDGTFKYRGSCLCGGEAGWIALESAANNFAYFNAVLSKWTNRGMTSYLNPNPKSRSITKNKNACEISVSLSFEETTLEVPEELEFIDVSVSITPSILQYEGQPVFQRGEWYITNLGYKNRAKYSLQGTARIKNCTNQYNGIFVIKNYLNSLANSIIFGTDPIMESCEIVESESDKKLVGFNASWSAMGAQFII